MDKKLFWTAISRFFFGVLLLGALLFVPAGSFAYWQAWLLMAILFVPMFLAGLVMLAKRPDLLSYSFNYIYKIIRSDVRMRIVKDIFGRAVKNEHLINKCL